MRRRNYPGIILTAFTIIFSATSFAQYALPASAPVEQRAQQILWQMTQSFSIRF